MQLIEPDSDLLTQFAQELVGVDDVLVATVTQPLEYDPTIMWAQWFHRQARDQMLGHMTVAWSGDTLHFQGLWAPRAGTLTHVVSTLPSFWRQRGVKRFTCNGMEPTAWHFFEAVGFMPIGHADPEWLTPEWYEVHQVAPQWRLEPHSPMFVADIHEGCRMEQYAAWKKGGIPEPGWHKQHAFRRAAGA